jgi:hypothetical protein
MPSAATPRPWHSSVWPRRVVRHSPLPRRGGIDWGAAPRGPLRLVARVSGRRRLGLHGGRHERRDHMCCRCAGPRRSLVGDGAAVHGADLARRPGARALVGEGVRGRLRAAADPVPRWPVCARAQWCSPTPGRSTSARQRRSGRRSTSSAGSQAVSKRAQRTASSTTATPPPAQAEGEGQAIHTGSIGLGVDTTGPWVAVVDQQLDMPLVEQPVDGMAPRP